MQTRINSAVIRWTMLSVALLLGVTACGAPTAPLDNGTGAAPVQDQTPQAGDTMTDTQWMLVSYGPADDQTLPINGSSVTLTLADGTVSGSGGCNSYSGSYTISGNALMVGELVSTEMACMDQATMQQEAVFLAALQSAQSIACAGDTLTIGYDDGELRFVPVAPTPDATLEGTNWQLESFITGDVAASVITGSTVTATFSEGKLTGSGGCNQYSGTYTTDGATLSISPVISTKMACEAAITRQEQSYFAALQQAQAYTIDGDQLRISYTGGELHFVRAS